MTLELVLSVYKLVVQRDAEVPITHFVVAQDQAQAAAVVQDMVERGFVIPLKAAVRTTWVRPAVPGARVGYMGNQVGRVPAGQRAKETMEDL